MRTSTKILGTNFILIIANYYHVSSQSTHGGHYSVPSRPTHPQRPFMCTSASTTHMRWRGKVRCLPKTPARKLLFGS